MPESLRLDRKQDRPVSMTTTFKTFEKSYSELTQHKQIHEIHLYVVYVTYMYEFFSTHSHPHVRSPALHKQNGKDKRINLSSFLSLVQIRTHAECPEGNDGCQQWSNTLLEAHNPQKMITSMTGISLVKVYLNRTSDTHAHTHTHTQSKPLSLMKTYAIDIVVSNYITVC